jgi:Ca2+-binding RTX toxin-like protein
MFLAVSREAAFGYGSPRDDCRFLRSTRPGEPAMPVNIRSGTSASELLDLAALVPDFPGDPWQVLGLGGDDTLRGAGAATTPDTLEGGDGGDLIIGNRGANLLTGDTAGGGGLPGKDTILGGNEALGRGDIIDGGAGNDSLDGQGGDDSIDGGEGRDLVHGGNGRDLLFGGEGADRLRGDAGDDQLHGDAGGDRLLGDAGHDSLDGGDGADTLQGGVGKDLLSGAAGDDSLDGAEGRDTLLGGADEDWIAGGVGRDLLAGGDGLDRFVYRAPEEGGDTIADFVGGGDLIVLSRAGLGLASAVGGALAAAELGAFGSFGAADAAAERIGLVNAGGTIWLTVNASAAGGDLVKLAVFTGGSPLGAGDFEIIA